MATILTGQIERVTFASADTDYAVLKMKIRGEQGLVTVVGNIVGPSPGEVLKMRGRWVNHSRFGWQFQVDTYETRAPASETGIRKYLGSGLIKGIGPVTAKRIVDKFKSDALDIIENDISRLQSVEGIGRKRISMIRDAWESQKEIRNVMLFLQSHEVSSAYAAKIFKQYGNEAIEVVTENPYRLADDIHGIGFVTADKIAEKLGMDKDAPKRTEAGIVYVLHTLSDDGHTCYPYDALVLKVRELLEVDSGKIEAAIEAARQDSKIVIETREDAPDVSAAGTRYVFLAPYYYSEKGIASRLNRIQQSLRNIRDVDVDKALEWVQTRLTVKLAEKQQLAVKKALKEKILVITGGPGTGKTTIINAVIKIFEKLDVKILLAAPTGRAAKRMNQATWHSAATIHRLLKFSLQKGGFEKNENNPLKCDLLIVDEASMIDTHLMYQLLKAVPDFSLLVLVGDVNQLPSVGAGDVLNDIICSGFFSVVELDTIFRQARKSMIVVNAHRINKGDFPVIDTGSDSDFFFIEREDPEAVVKVIVELAASRIKDRFGFDVWEDIQVLTPMHKGAAGAANLNAALQKALNAGKEGITRDRGAFFVNDKVMQIRNNYDKAVFNGDIGTITAIDHEDQALTVRFDSREVAYDFSGMDELVHAYAISVHKSQGSEYPVVIIPVVTQHYILLQRNLIYTAVTRGKKLVVMVGTKKALAMGIRKAKTEKRYTGLRTRLKEQRPAQNRPLFF